MKHLTLFLLLCTLGCNANEVLQGYPPQIKGERQWPEWPDNGTFWECMIEIGFIDDSDDAHGPQYILDLPEEFQEFKSGDNINIEIHGDTILVRFPTNSSNANISI